MKGCEIDRPSASADGVFFQTIILGPQPTLSERWRRKALRFSALRVLRILVWRPMLSFSPHCGVRGEGVRQRRQDIGKTEPAISHATATRNSPHCGSIKPPVPRVGAMAGVFAVLLLQNLPSAAAKPAQLRSFARVCCKFPAEAVNRRRNREKSSRSRPGMQTEAANRLRSWQVAGGRVLATRSNAINVSSNSGSARSGTMFGPSDGARSGSRASP